MSTPETLIRCRELHAAFRKLIPDTAFDELDPAVSESLHLTDRIHAHAEARAREATHDMIGRQSYILGWLTGEIENALQILLRSTDPAAIDYLEKLRAQYPTTSPTDLDPLPL